MKPLYQLVAIFVIVILSFIGFVNSSPANDLYIDKNTNSYLDNSKDTTISDYVNNIATSQTSEMTQNIKAAILKTKYVDKTLIELNSYPPNYGYGQYVYEKDLPNPYRIIKPGMMISFLFVQNRLNLNVDAKDKILNAYYG